MEKPKLSLIDLFCGAGGFSTGFLIAGEYDIKAGVDIKGFMERSFIQNHPGAKFFQYDIRESPPQEILELNPDLVIGSPPCQGFSDARGVRYRLDRKNDLVFKYFEWIDQIQPKIAIMENVKGMSTIGKAWRSLEDPGHEEDIDFMELLEETVKKIGFTFTYDILNSRDFGVPQERERVFCLMIRKDLKKKFSLPSPTHGEKEKETKQTQLDEFLGSRNQKSEKELQPFVTVNEALLGLPNPSKYEQGNHIDTSSLSVQHPRQHTWFQQLIFNTNLINNHISRYPKNEEVLEIIKRIPEGVTYRSDRLGDKHIGVWEVFKNQLSEEERELLKDIAILRTKNHIKTRKGKYSEGYVPREFLEEKGHSKEILENLVKRRFLKHPTSCHLTEKAKHLLNRIQDEESSLSKQTTDEMVTKADLAVLNKLSKLQSEVEGSDVVRDYQLGILTNTLRKLVRLGWIKTGKVEEEYDLTAKAGHRGRYSRIAMGYQSRTLMTGFTNLNEILHPKENRGLSLREGARLMSFPDSFTFYGTFSQISLQIGNAVAPLVARQIAINLLKEIN